MSENWWSTFPNFNQTEDAFRRASKKINVADGWEEILDETCLRHAGKWKLEQDLDLWRR